MKKLLNSLVIFLILSAGHLAAQLSDLDRHKIFSDLVSMAWSVEYQDDSKPYKADLEALMKQMEALGHVDNWGLPYALRFEGAEAKKEYDALCGQARNLMEKVRKVVEGGMEDGPPKQLITAYALSAEHNGDYYFGIEPTGDLENHPLAGQIQCLYIQDYSFAEAMNEDAALQTIYDHAPDVRVIYLFGAELEDHILAGAHLEKLPELRAIDLAENYLSEIPVYLMKAPKLVSLDLRQNDINRLPEDLSALRQLRYLDLKGNPLSADDVARLREALPDTEIEF